MKKTQEKYKQRELIKELKKVKDNKGITLIALVVTIVILLILSGITINMLLREDGIINRAEVGAEDYIIEATREELSMVLIDAVVEKQINPDYDDNEFLDNFIYEREPNADVDGEEISLNGYTFELDRSVPQLGEYLGPAENLPARISKIEYAVDEKAMAISVTVSAVRLENVANPQYKYSIKEEGQDDSEYIEKVTEAENKYTYDNLEEKKYIIKVELISQGVAEVISYKVTEPIELKIVRPTTVEEAIESGLSYADTTPITDEYDNTVYIPGGFKLAEDSGATVEEGIVIEDSTNRNQFVWIPVGTYKVSSELSETGTLTNNLSRRTFTSSGASEVIGDNVIGLYYRGEGYSSSIASSTIGAFKTSATTKGGFYIGRYEQGTGNVCKAGVEPYVSVTRDTANTQAKAMYNGNSYVTSELISSYAWDTTLNYICQTNSAGYTLATTTSSTYGNIGTRNPTTTGAYEADKYSKICDFLGNRREWTTEYSSISKYPCVRRGGYYHNRDHNASRRYNDDTSHSYDYIGFRTQLYIKYD